MNAASGRSAAAVIVTVKNRKTGRRTVRENSVKTDDHFETFSRPLAGLTKESGKNATQAFAYLPVLAREANSSLKQSASRRAHCGVASSNNRSRSQELLMVGEQLSHAGIVGNIARGKSGAGPSRASLFDRSQKGGCIFLTGGRHRELNLSRF